MELSQLGTKSLKDLIYSLQYRSDRNILARDLYEYCLPYSSRYYRAVGFFSSSVFLIAPEAFHAFFENDGRMQVVCSPILSARDIEALQKGYRDRHLYAKNDLLYLLKASDSVLEPQLSKLLSWLLAKRLFDIKIAKVVPEQGSQIYHEKLGIFEDVLGHQVAFSGSANESAAALKGNFESIDIFRSWKEDEQRRVLRKRHDFEALWSNDTNGLEIYTFPEAARQGILRQRNTLKNDAELLESEDTEYQNAPKIKGLEETISIPIHLKLHPHQVQAIREWFVNKGQGLLEMATGSGKTITALSIAAKLYELVGPPLQIVIVCPYLHLVHQWADEARQFGLEPLICTESRTKWHSTFTTRVYNLVSGQRPLSSVITSNATFASTPFQRLLNNIRGPVLFVADEAHNLGARRLRQCLPEHAQYRLGLSATPERWYDEEGTDALFAYFGQKLVSYTLKQALQDGVLCPYKYYPYLVELTDEEYDQYYDLSVKIAQLIAQEEDLDNPSSGLELILIKRARLLAVAKNKLNMLEYLMTPLKTSTHNLVYCGDGSVESDMTEELVRQVEAVTRMLGHRMGMKVAKYTAETPMDRRHQLRRQFADGDIQALVAIRCLDEGVDIPETRRAFILASSTNPRQFIQRRGRLLRRSPGKELAEIYDFMIQPPQELTDPHSEYYTVNRNLFKKELVRAIEFAHLAVNGPEAMSRLLPLQNQLNLLHIDVDGE